MRGEFLKIFKKEIMEKVKEREENKKEKKKLGFLEAFKNTFSAMFEEEQSQEEIEKEIKAMNMTTLQEGSDYIVKNKKPVQQENKEKKTTRKRVSAKSRNQSPNYPRKKREDLEIGE